MSKRAACAIVTASLLRLGRLDAADAPPGGMSAAPLPDAISVPVIECLARQVPSRSAPACTQILAAYDDEAAVAALVQALDHPREEVRGQAAEGLVARGETAARALARAFVALPKDDAVRRERLVQVLLDLGDAGERSLYVLHSAALPVVVARALAERNKAKPHAVRGEFYRNEDPATLRVLEARRPEATALLIAELRADAPPERRVKAMRWLTDLKGRSAIGPLIAALDDPEPYIRRAALGALGNLGSETEVEVVLAGTRDKDWEAALAAHWALVKMGPKVLPHLERIAAAPVASPDQTAQRIAAVRALAYMGEPGIAALQRAYPESAVALVQCRARHADDSVARWPLSTAIRRVAGREAAAAFLGKKDGVWDAEPLGVPFSTAVGVLAEIGDVPSSSADCSAFDVRSLVPALVLNLDDVCDWQRVGPAAHALGAIGDPEAVDGLLGFLASRRRCSGWTGLPPPLIEEVATALGKIGDRRAIGPLIAIVEDTDRDPSTRIAAEGALRRIGDPRGLRAAEEYRAAPTSLTRPTRRVLIFVATLLLLGPAAVALAGRHEPAAHRMFVAGIAYASLRLGWAALGALGDRTSMLHVFGFGAGVLVVSIALRGYVPASPSADSATTAALRRLVLGSTVLLVGAVLTCVASLAYVVLSLWFLWR